MATSQEHITRDRLDHLCLLVTDGTHDSPTLQPSGVPFIKGKHISGGFVDFDNCDYITFKDHIKAIQRSKPEYGNILFSNIGSVGDAAYINTQSEFSIKNVALFKPDPRVVDSKYLYYVVIGPKFKGELFAKRSGVAQPFFSLEMLRSHEVEYHHELPTQRKIAAILSAYDDLIENNLRRIKVLEEMAQNLYREWFVKFRFPACATGTAGRPGHQHARFTDSPLGRIPEGWEVKRLGQLSDQIRDGVNPDSVDPETPYFGLEHLPRKSITLSDWGIANEVQSTKLLFKKGDILFGKIRPYFHKVGVAPLPGVCSSDTIVIRPRSVDWFGLVLGCTSSAEFVEHATATSQGRTKPLRLRLRSRGGRCCL